MAGLAMVWMAALAHGSAFAESIRVGLTGYNSAAQLTLSASPSLSVSRVDTGESLVAEGTDLILSVQGSKVSVKSGAGEAVLSDGAVLAAPNDPSAILSLVSNGRTRKYRGSVEVSAKNGALRVVNVVDVDDYLLGVLPSEMPDSYPEEAIKAQAISARTYALRNSRKHAAQGFRICDTSHCQTYGGVLAEKPKSTQAVLDTKGMVLTFDGQIADVMYSTDCGGATRNYSSENPTRSFPYLCGVVDPDDIPHICWEQNYTLHDLAVKLIKAGVKGADGLLSVVISKTEASGRALEVEITSSTGKNQISGEKIRSALGLKSTLFSIESTTDGGVAIKGKGFGHGVGMCQTGAKGLALPPHSLTCEQILAHYFPGTAITPAASQTTAQTTHQDIHKAASKGAGKDMAKEQPLPVLLDIRLEAPDQL
ncbi:SpoIID/LytB domain-containing protein [bacterium]|nr:SpoIID/LytB domain-containing protein [bacterium]